MHIRMTSLTKQGKLYFRPITAKHERALSLLPMTSLI